MDRSPLSGKETVSFLKDLSLKDEARYQFERIVGVFRFDDLVLLGGDALCFVGVFTVVVWTDWKRRD